MEVSKEIIEQLILNDKAINDKYKINKKIGEGSFGMVYQVRNFRRSLDTVLKVEYINKNDKKKKSSLLNQGHILKVLRGEKGIPWIKFIGKWEHGNFLEMRMLQRTLDDERNKKFSEGEIVAMARELLQLLKRIHENGVVHQDLKPQNIMRDENGKLYIIDFGLSSYDTKRFRRERKKNLGFIGTPRYASIAAHKGNEQTPQDDVESLFYILAYLYLKKLPWQKLQISQNKKLDQILNLKLIAAKDMFEKMGENFFDAFEYTTKTEEENFDHDKLIEIVVRRRKSTYLIITETEHIEKFQSSCFRDVKLHHQVQKELMNSKNENFLTSNFSEKVQFYLKSEQKSSNQKSNDKFLDFSWSVSSGSDGKISNNSRFTSSIRFKNPFSRFEDPKSLK